MQLKQGAPLCFNKQRHRLKLLISQRSSKAFNCCLVLAVLLQALVAAELRSSARMAAICEWGSNPARLPAAAYDKSLLESAEAPLLLTEGPVQMAGSLSQPLWLAPSSGAGTGAGSYTQPGCNTLLGPHFHQRSCVDDMLEANRRLLDRL